MMDIHTCFIKYACLIQKAISLFLFLYVLTLFRLFAVNQCIMKLLNLILAILIISCCPFDTIHAFFDKDIRMLTMQDGLADNTIPCIYKDEDGFMWFGTSNGLSRYDGKTVRNFKPAEAYKSISSIVRLSDDYLGILSDGVLYYFNRKLETFTPSTNSSDADKLAVTRVLPAGESSFWGISLNKLVAKGVCRNNRQRLPEYHKPAVPIRLCSDKLHTYVL